MENIEEIFGRYVFNDAEMQKRLSEKTYQQLRNTIKKGEELDLSIADEIAEAVRIWAIENGATHFTHWFHPLNGATAEKHDSFIESGKGGRVITSFAGKNLIKGEPDASSFPSGGLRDTFEARGYTAWDPTSYMFIKDGILCIPTVFCSYNGQALDHKMPLLKSMDALNRQAMRIIRLFGNQSVDHVKTTAGPEQEYFLIDEKLYGQRRDLIYCGRTLFGAAPPKGQEMNDHYFGAIKTKVSRFMKDLNSELWKLGVLAKTEHNEVAPSQHELATIYLTTNVSTDHNNLVMEVMKKTARRHGLVCLLHEKPFAYVNGSGKHNNWSLKTDTGINLLEPGDTPAENAQFLLFLSAVIKAVDEYQDLIRISVSSAGNDHRLGASEAPPAIVSVFLGTELTEILQSIEDDVPYQNKDREPMRIGVHTIPAFPKDNTDRNRTSPFAFTGNKFEFRMPGSSQSIATPNTVLNTVVAEELRKFADELENCADLNMALHQLIRKTIHEHKRIIFNGNGYDPAWVAEAARRGLSNYPDTPSALEHLLDEKNVEVYVRHGVLSREELLSRYEIYLERYSKTINIEARTMLAMIRRDILPASSRYSGQLAQVIVQKSKVNGEFPSYYEKSLLNQISQLTSDLYDNSEKLAALLDDANKPQQFLAEAFYYRDDIIPLMKQLRSDADQLETLTDRSNWPIPVYEDLLFSIS